MSSITSIEFEGEDIQLLPPALKNYKDNKFTLIIGENATGKSRILGRIVNKINEANQLVSELGGEYKPKGIELNINFPASVIVVTSAYNDKFPFSLNDEENSYYRYCGIRETSNASWISSVSRKTIENIFSISNFKGKSTLLIEILDVLGFSSDLRLVLKFKNFRKIVEGDIDENHIRGIVETNNERRYRMKSRTLDNVTESDIKDCLNVLKSIRYDENARVGELSIDLLKDNSFIDNVYNNINILRRIGIVKSVELKVDNDKNKKSHLFTDASSGEAQLLFSLSSIIRYATNNSIIIIDEPEISLHPNWQVRYFSILKEALRKVNDCHVIVASHSHFLVSDLDPINSHLVSLVRDNDGVLSKEISNSTYGWSPESVLYNIFNVRTTNSIYLERDLSLALSMISSNNCDISKLKELNKKFVKLTLDKKDPLNELIKSIDGYLKNND
ncbi:AAA family ATPase [Shewanella sp. S1-58-MNA-CIBAN-0166]|uniref:AAA family ATPase n=1 Tax=Shewanella sp. S1-58-MNA-CIBAN-0166 TaxID=3140467 RepID=UPI00332DDC58